MTVLSIPQFNNKVSTLASGTRRSWRGFEGSTQVSGCFIRQGAGPVRGTGPLYFSRNIVSGPRSCRDLVRIPGPDPAGGSPALDRADPRVDPGDPLFLFLPVKPIGMAPGVGGDLSGSAIRPLLPSGLKRSLRASGEYPSARSLFVDLQNPLARGGCCG
ncbi:hypothetical protein ES703_21557 [subsurface metagenome]